MIKSTKYDRFGKYFWTCFHTKINPPCLSLRSLLTSSCSLCRRPRISEPRWAAGSNRQRTTCPRTAPSSRPAAANTSWGQSETITGDSNIWHCDDDAIRDLWRVWVSPCVVACGWGPGRSRWSGGTGPEPAGLYWTELQGPSPGSPSTEAAGWSAAGSECVSWKHTDTFQTCLFTLKASQGPWICHILWRHDCKEN